jgi:urea transport system permease protein
VSEALPQSWLFIQGGLFILVVTALPEGVIGWFQGDGPRNLLNRLGMSRRSGTYPRLELDGQEEIQP